MQSRQSEASIKHKDIFKHAFLPAGIVIDRVGSGSSAQSYQAVRPVLVIGGANSVSRWSIGVAERSQASGCTNLLMACHVFLAVIPDLCSRSHPYKASISLHPNASSRGT